MADLREFVRRLEFIVGINESFEVILNMLCTGKDQFTLEITRRFELLVLPKIR